MTMSIDGNGIVTLDKLQCIEIIKSNTDLESKEIDERLLLMIYKYFNRMTDKQSKWLREKIKYIIRHNNDYKVYKKVIKDISFNVSLDLGGQL
jgi:hypothetical protein